MELLQAAFVAAEADRVEDAGGECLLLGMGSGQVFGCDDAAEEVEEPVRKKGLSSLEASRAERSKLRVPNRIKTTKDLDGVEEEEERRLAAHRKNRKQQVDTSRKEKVVLALPCTAVAGTLVRSADNVFTGRPSTLPLTAISRWALLRALVDAIDC